MNQAWVVALVSPLIMAVALWLMQRSGKREDWRREDAVRLANEARQDRIEAATRAALEQAEKAAELLVANNELVQHTSADVAAKLVTIEDGNRVIHRLVNSDRTALLEDKLAGNRRELAGNRRELALLALLGRDPSADLTASVETLTSTIATQASELSMRAEQTESVAALSAATFPPPSD